MPVAREEARLRDEFLKAVGALPGVFAYRSEVIRGQQKQRSLPEGHPDLVFIAAGKVIFIEWKSPTGRLEPSQVIWHRTARAASATVLVCCDPAEACATVAALLPEPESAMILNAGKKITAGQKTS